MAKKTVVTSEEPQPEEQVQPVQEQTVQPETGAVVAPQVSKIPLVGKARAMRDQLASQPKVRVFIPLAPGEKQGVTQSVILNGYPLYIRKGEYVDVPKSVADVLEIKLKHKMSIENHPDRIKADGKVNLTTFGA
jgi:hypothetical protein